MKNLYRKTKNSFDWRLNLSAISNNMDNVLTGLDLGGVISLPALFIRGSLSDYIKDEHERIIKNYFPKAEIKTIEGVGHWVHAEAPNELCNLLSSFLEKPCNFEDT
jgi:pimeloyl-ACP methyl ester carboxylesterase